jgi:hypothetical protein
MQKRKLITALLKQNLVRLRRSPEFNKRLATNIVLGILLAVLLADLLYVSLNINILLRNIPGANPVKLINEIAFIYFPIDYILRLIFQKYRSVSIKPYLILNIPRESIVDIMLIKTSQSLLNLVPFFLFLPFALTEMLLHYSLISVTAWFLTIFFVCFVNAYIANYSKIMFRIYPVKTILVHVVVFGIVAASAFLLSPYPKLWSSVLKVVLQNPYLCLTPLVTAMLVFQMNHRFLFANLFIEEEKNSEKEKVKREKDLKESFTFLSSFGKAGQFILLEIKMILRNKRPKPLLYMSFFFVFYGLLFYTQPMYGDYFKVFVGSFMSGVFLYTYGILIFGWESSYFGFIMTTHIDMQTYLRAKYYFMAAVTTVLYLLTSFYVIFGIKILFINTALFLFNLGITPFIILFMATFNKIKYNLAEGMYSQQGKGTQQYLGSLIVMGLQMGLLYVLRLFLSFENSMVVFAVIGLTGAALHIKFISIIEKFFYTKKYSMIAGFKQT